jgi:hypothetical protein
MSVPNDTGIADTDREIVVTDLMEGGFAMKSLSVNLPSLHTGLHWIARLLAGFVVGLVLLFFFGTGGFNPLKLTAIEAVQMIFFLTTCIGLVIAWRWELTGGAIATAAMLLFYCTELAVTGGFPRGWVFRLMLLPGFFFLISGLLEKRSSSTATPPIAPGR